MSLEGRPRSEMVEKCLCMAYALSRVRGIDEDIYLSYDKFIFGYIGPKYLVCSIDKGIAISVHKTC